MHLIHKGLKYRHTLFLRKIVCKDRYLVKKYHSFPNSQLILRNIYYRIFIPKTTVVFTTGGPPQNTEFYET